MSLDETLAALHPAQRAAVTHPARPLLLACGPGSGKTRTLTHRIQWLIDHEGLDPTAMDGLLEAPHRVRDVLAAGTLEERRAVVRNFLAGIRIEKSHAADGSTLVPPAARLTLKLVELRGIEPLTPRLPASCSPS